MIDDLHCIIHQGDTLNPLFTEQGSYFCDETPNQYQCVECLCNYPFPRGLILDSFKLKEFADDNFKFDENGRKFLKQVENTAGKGEIARYEQFLLFLQYF